MTGTVLVVAHEGYRNGATRVLLDVLGPLRVGTGRPLRIEVQREGPLSAALRAHHDDPSPLSAPGAVLVNSALAVGVLARIDEGVRAVVYVHEVGEGLAALAPAEVRLLAERADQVYCVSKRSRDDLNALGVPIERLHLLPPPVVRRRPDPQAVAAARADAGLHPGERLVIGCGEASWRKGTDLFVGLARALGERGDVRLEWVGRRHRSVARHLDTDTARAGVGDRLRWVGEVDDALPHLAAADLLVMTSREDPQPLVALEAAMAGTPTVGFSGTGLDDLAARAAARTVPYPDLTALADEVVLLLDDPEHRSRLVVAADAIVATERTPEAVAAVLASAIGTTGRGPTGRPAEESP